MPGKTLGPYRIERQLGAGGMGKVWLAWNKAGEPFAIKVLHPQLLERPGFFKRFLREAEIGKAIRHPNVVRTFDVDALSIRGAQHLFLVMEYVEGQTLRALLAELGRVPEELARHIGVEIATALEAIHGAGILHRDLKPENVLITPDHVVKVMDLGVARLKDEEIRLSQTGAFVGSIQYAAPEQFAGPRDSVDHRADLHALGVLLYELTAGRHPYAAADMNQALKRILSEPPEPLGELCPQVSPFFEEVVHRLLAKDRENRFASAAEVRRVLTQSETSGWWQDRARRIRRETRRPLRRVRVARETGVHGREAELTKLREAFAAAREGAGRALLIEGEAGIGKTRLIDEFVARLESEGEDFDFLFGSYPPGGAATAAGAWATAYRERFGPEGLSETLAEYLQETPGLVPAFTALLRGEPTVPGTEPLAKESIHTVFVNVTRALAARRPTVVLIEDLHFAPADGLALLTALALATPESRVLLLGTTRPGLPEGFVAGFDRPDHAECVVLSRLGPRDLADLLTDALHSRPLADEIGMQIARKSDGNPFFAFEILRGLKEGGFLREQPDGSFVRTKAFEEIAIPSTVLELIGARIAELDEAEREFLDVAACCGFEFDPRVPAKVLGLEPIPALRGLGRLERDRRLVRSVGPRFRFDHVQIREVLYAGISEPLREEYHAAVADALRELNDSDAVGLCTHYFLGGRPRDALVHLDGALDVLDAGHSAEAAADLTGRALVVEGLVTGRRRIELLLRHVEQLDLLGRRDRQEAAADEAVALAPSGSLGARARVARGVLSMKTGRHGAARTEFEEAAFLAQEAGDEALLASITGSLGSALAAQGRLEEAREHHVAQLSLAREIGDLRNVLTAHANLGNVLRAMGRPEEALEHHEQAAAAAARAGDERREGLVAGNLGICLWELGRYAEARRQFERALDLARRVGDRHAASATTGNLGLVELAQGRYAEARRCFESHVRLAREVGDRVGESAAIGNLGTALDGLGLHGEALARKRDHVRLAREVGQPMGVAVSRMSLGLTLLALGDRAEAETSFAAARAVAEEIGARGTLAHVLHGLALLKEQAEEREAALVLHEEALTVARESGNRKGAAGSLVALGRVLLDLGRREEAKERLDEAARIATEIGARGAAVLAACLAARLPGGDPHRAAVLLERHGEELSVGERLEALFTLHTVTGEAPLLAAARDLLDSVMENAPAEYRESLARDVPLYRAIRSAPFRA